MIPPIKGRDADGICATQFMCDSGGNLHSALSWLDYAERKQFPIALLYSGLHLRLAIEHLWFEIFVASRGAAITEAEYQKALSNSTTLYKLIDRLAPDYARFVEFVKHVASLDSKPHPPSISWDIARLRRIHGELSGRLLHFHGEYDRGAFSDTWITSQSRFLHDQGYWMWDNLVSRGNLIVFQPRGLKPDAFAIWEDFRDGKIDSEAAYTRLKIAHPIIAAKSKKG